MSFLCNDNTIGKTSAKNGKAPYIRLLVKTLKVVYSKLTIRNKCVDADNEVVLVWEKSTRELLTNVVNVDRILQLIIKVNIEGFREVSRKQAKHP